MARHWRAGPNRTGGRKPEQFFLLPPDRCRIFASAPSAAVLPLFFSRLARTVWRTIVRCEAAPTVRRPPKANHLLLLFFLVSRTVRTVVSLLFGGRRGAGLSSRHLSLAVVSRAKKKPRRWLEQGVAAVGRDDLIRL